MKTAIIGPGALGCLVAAYLKEAGLDVTLLDHRPERANQLVAHGIKLQGARGDHHVHVPVTTDAKTLGPIELVIILVKAFQTEQALQQHRSVVGHDTTVWSIQNGLGNIDAMARAVPDRNIVAGSTSLGACRLDDRTFHHAGEGDTFIGELDGSLSDRVERIANQMSAAGISTQVRADMQRVIWSKLLVNLGINALSAILRLPNGALFEHPSARRLMQAAVYEGVQAARKQGLHFDTAKMQAKVEEIAKRTAQNRSSMLQDILANRQTEIDVINGAVARLTNAPVNRTLTDLVHALETTAPSIQPARNPDAETCNKSLIPNP